MENERIFYVYVLFRPWDGSPFYIGKGKGRRWAKHHRYRSQHNYHFENIIKKTDKLGLEIPSIKIRSNLSESEAFQIERAMIASIGRHPNGSLVNLTAGGEGASGAKRSISTREKMSQAAIGNKRPLGTKRSPETIAKLKAIASRRPEDYYKKTGLAQRGKKLSAEYREKLRIAHTGKSLSDEHKRRIGDAHRGMTYKKVSTSITDRSNESANC